MSTLEAQLTALTREFVGRLVEAIRNASFAEVAGLSTFGATGPAEPKVRRVVAPRAAVAPAAAREAGKARQTASHRAELGERVVEALRSSSAPMGVRALSGELAVPPDHLAGPIRELRAAGKIHKHGEKRSTTYSAA